MDYDLFEWLTGREQVKEDGRYPWMGGSVWYKLVTKPLSRGRTKAAFSQRVKSPTVVQWQPQHHHIRVQRVQHTPLSHLANVKRILIIKHRLWDEFLLRVSAIEQNRTPITHPAHSPDLTD
jgi:hypothetical protein